MKLIFFYLLLLVPLLSCNYSNLGKVNPETGLPYLSEEEASELESGIVRQERYMSDWGGRAWDITPTSRSGDCIRPVHGSSAAELLRYLLTQDRVYRESLGNKSCACLTINPRDCGVDSCPRCICEPMGNSCLEHSCSCQEICPNHHGILSHARTRMDPDEGDGFAFANATTYDGTVFTGSGVGDGKCTGVQLQRRKWAALAEFDDQKVSNPAMSVGDDTWKAFMRAQIDRMIDGLNPHFFGINSLSDLSAHPDIAAYFTERTGGDVVPDELDSSRFRFTPYSDASTVDFSTQGSGSPLREVKIYFDQKGVRTISAHTEYDDSTNPPTAIPSMHNRNEYHHFIQAQARKVSQGHAAIIPGFANMYQISNQASYAQIIADAAISDWQDMNLMDERIGLTDPSTTLVHRPNVSIPDIMAPNGAVQNERLLEQLRQRLPVVPATTLPRFRSLYDPNWNREGPYQGVSLEVMALQTSVTKNGTLIKPAPTAGVNGEFLVPSDLSFNDERRTFYHSLEAYALYEQLDGSVKICLSDPNNTREENSSCNNTMIIPAPNASGHRDGRITYPGHSPNIQIGRVELQPSSDAYQAQITQNLIQYCRRKNSRSSDCNGGTP